MIKHLNKPGSGLAHRLHLEVLKNLRAEGGDKAVLAYCDDLMDRGAQGADRLAEDHLMAARAIREATVGASEVEGEASSP